MVLTTTMMITAYILGCVSSLAGVALGGWFVYRTKREPYESMFSKPEGDAYNIDDLDSFEDLTADALNKRFEGPKDAFIDDSFMKRARERFEEQAASGGTNG